MADQRGGRAPYAAVSFAFALTAHPIFGPYVRGRLELADAYTRLDVGSWVDAVYAIVADRPRTTFGEKEDPLEALHKAQQQFQNWNFPDRDTWGLTEEHQAAMSGLL